MADILKISTPLVDRAPVQATRPSPDPSVPFNLSDVTRVIQTADPTEILQQNTGYVPKEEAPRILADLLRDPSVTVSLMKNITMLQEVIQLLPGQSAALTQEIEQLFDALLLSPDQIVAELMRQDENTSMFKGEVFDMLRNMLSEQAGEKPELATNIGVLLKGLNAAMTRTDTLDSVANNLTYLLGQVQSSPRLTERLETLIARLHQPDAGENFPALKEEVFATLKDIENSLLFTPQMEKVLPLIVYNLSRYNDNEDFLPDALRLLLANMDGDAERAELVEKLQAWVDRYLPPEGAKFTRGDIEESRVMDVLAKIIGRQADSEELQLLSGDKLEKIIHSLLSSPSNFTPLLHFIIPVQDEDLRAFAEIWIDPNADEEEIKRRGGAAGDATHMLLVFDVESIGRFEAELFVHDKRIAMNLLCPPAYVSEFRGVGPAIRTAVQSIGYSFESINIDKLERTHSLMQVFTDLPHRRTGIDVRI